MKRISVPALLCVLRCCDECAKHVDWGCVSSISVESRGSESRGSESRGRRVASERAEVSGLDDRAMVLGIHAEEKRDSRILRSSLEEMKSLVTAGPVPFAPPPLPLQQCRPDHSPTHLTSLPVSARIPALTCAPYLPISTFNALR